VAAPVARRNRAGPLESGVTMRIFRTPLLTLACSAALIAGCGEKKDTTESPSSTATDTAASAPQSDVAFVTPKDGAKVNSALLCKVKLTNFTIDPKAVGQSPQPGRGHLHFSLDDGKFDHPKYSGKNGKIAVSLNVDGKYSPALAPNITYKNLPKGKHRLEVYLANNNHTNIGPEAETEIVVK
jgi:hypothetical protein